MSRGAATDGVYEDNHRQPHLNACQTSTCLLWGEKRVTMTALTAVHQGHPNHSTPSIILQQSDRRSKAIEERPALERKHTVEPLNLDGKDLPFRSVTIKHLPVMQLISSPHWLCSAVNNSVTERLIVAHSINLASF